MTDKACAFGRTTRTEPPVGSVVLGVLVAISAYRSLLRCDSFRALRPGALHWESLEVSSLDQASKVLLDLRRRWRRIHQQTQLDVPLLRRFGEVRRCRQGLLPVDVDALRVQSTARRLRRYEGPWIVEHLRYSCAVPFVLDEVPGEVLDEQTLDRRVSGRTPDVEAQSHLQRVDLVEALRQLSEYHRVDQIVRRLANAYLLAATVSSRQISRTPRMDVDSQITRTRHPGRLEVLPRVGIRRPSPQLRLQRGMEIAIRMGQYL